MSSYGDDKARDMARGLLASSRRKRARFDKRAVNSRVRSRVRRALNRHDVDAPDLFLDVTRAGMDDVVGERRTWDSPGPILRWASAKADDLGDTPSERYVALRAALPDGVVGWHAMTHIEFIDEYHRDPPSSWSTSRLSFDPWAASRAALVRGLHGCVDRQGELNALLKAHALRMRVDGRVVRADVRCWHGRHDIDDFAVAVFRAGTCMIELVFRFLQDSA